MVATSIFIFQPWIFLWKIHRIHLKFALKILKFDTWISHDISNLLKQHSLKISNNFKTLQSFKTLSNSCQWSFFFKSFIKQSQSSNLPNRKRTYDVENMRFNVEETKEWNQWTWRRNLRPYSVYEWKWSEGERISFFT